MAEALEWRKECEQCGGKGYVNDCPSCKVKYRRQRYELDKAEAKRERELAKEQSADELISQIEDGTFRVDQKWLLTELIRCYKDDKVKEKLKALQMIKEVGGYNESSGDEKAVIDSLVDSLANEPEPKD